MPNHLILRIDIDDQNGSRSHVDCVECDGTRLMCVYSNTVLIILRKEGEIIICLQCFSPGWGLQFRWFSSVNLESIGYPYQQIFVKYPVASIITLEGI